MGAGFRRDRISQAAARTPILDLERRTGLRLRNEALTIDALSTIGALVRYLEALGAH